MPLVVPRASFRIVEDKTQRLLDRLGLQSDDASRPEHELLAAAQGSHIGFDRTTFARMLVAPFAAALEQIRPQIEPTGTGMAGAVAKTRATVETAVDRLAKKYEKTLRHRDHDIVNAVRYLKQRLHPRGSPQERVFGLSYFAARYGDRELIERVLATIAPFDPSTRDLKFSEVHARSALAASVETPG
jgi:uncharacterized protein YllA (UPF0747 family)